MMASLVSSALVAFLAVAAPAPILAATKGKRHAPVAHHATAPRLANNRWRPIRIGYENVIVPAGQHEPWIQLDPRQKRVTGSGGCNRISGTYQSGDSTLRFGALITTKLAKPRSEEHTSELQSHSDLVCRLLLEKKKKY